MRVNEVITFQIYNNGIWTDYTYGILDIRIVRGCQDYKGPQTLVDVGQLQIVSRNPNLDPYANSSVRYGKQIRILANTVPIFTGKIDGIDVQYRAKDDPIITLTGLDIFGFMQKQILSTAFVQQDLTNWSTIELLQQLAADQEVADFYNNAIVHDGTNNVNSSINSNITAWDALASRVVTDLGFVYANNRNYMNYYRYPTTDPLHPNNSRPIKASFDYAGSNLSYKTINVNDGFENIVNQLDVSGETGYWSSINGNWTSTSASFTEIQEPSKNLWGSSRNSLKVLTTNPTTVQNITDAIFVEISNPVREIYEISYDASKYPDIAKDIDILDNININHLINQTTTIDRKYGVVGIRHEIGYDYWRVTYLVKNWNIQETAMATPTIHVSPASGDQFTDFTFSYTIDPSESITSQYWTLGEGFTSSNPTVTVNYLNPGVKNISLTVTNIYGWQKTVTLPLTVGAAPPITSFTYSVIDYNRYQFTFTGQEAVSYYWNFGNGRTSTEQNPITYFESATPVTVTLTATNAYGSAQAQQTFTPVIVSRLPIRYVRLVSYRSYSTQYLSAYGIKELEVYDGSTNVAQGKSLDVEERIAFFTSSTTFYDTNNRLVKESNQLVSTYLLNGVTSQTLYPRNHYTTDTWAIDWNVVDRIINGVTQTSRTISDNSTIYDNVPMTITIDLGQEYFNITSINLKKDPYSLGLVFDVLVSKTGSTWYNAGRLLTTGTSGTGTFTPTTTLPITTSWPTYSVASNIIPIRYLKIVANNTTFNLAGVYAASGTSTAIPGTTTSAKNDGRWSLGSLNTDNETGTQFRLGPNSCSVSVYSGNNTIGTYHAGDLIPGTILNDRTPTTGISWSSTSPTLELILDFGTTHYNVGVIGFDTRNTNSVSTTTSANSFTVYTSNDGTNWTLLDTVPMTTAGTANMYQTRTYTWQPSNSTSIFYGVPFTNTNRTVVKTT